jgi:L-asparaginase II
VPNPASLSPDVVVTRGGVVESRHRVHAAVVDASGNLIAVAGDPDIVTFWRSCAKPFQLAPFMRAGGAERFKWTDDEIALACASHGGEPEHVTVAARMLGALGLEEGDLACGTHEPMSRRGAELARDANTLTRLHNNCSGKHAAMLARAVLADWPTAGYHRADHPVQQEILSEIAAWCDVAARDIPVAVDGCAVPVFALPLRAMAVAYARLGRDFADGKQPGARIVAAMRAKPFLVGGTERFDTTIAEETDGAIIAKVGAEGVHCAMIPQRGLGVAIKVEDGALRAQHAALLAVLAQIGALPASLPDRLAEFARRPLKNTRGETVGEIGPRASSA